MLADPRLTRSISFNENALPKKKRKQIGLEVSTVYYWAMVRDLNKAFNSEYFNHDRQNVLKHN